MRIRIKYFTDKIEKLDYIAGKSDWIDLRAAEEVELKGRICLDSSRVAMELPRGIRGPTLFRGAAPLKLWNYPDEPYGSDRWDLLR